SRVRQIGFVAVGLAAMLIEIAIDSAWYRANPRFLYGLMLGLMALVFLAGSVSRGSRRWIDFSFFRFQPSEFCKLLLVLFLAAFLADRASRIEDLRTPFLTVALAAPPILLVFGQPDLGTALVLIAALGACLFIGGVRWPHLA